MSWYIFILFFFIPNRYHENGQQSFSNIQYESVFARQQICISFFHVSLSLSHLKYWTWNYLACAKGNFHFFSLILRTIAHRCEFSRIISVGNSHRFILLYISHRLDKMKLDFAWTCNVNTKLSRTYEAFADFITKWNFPVNLIHMTRCVRGVFFFVYMCVYLLWWNSEYTITAQWTNI